MSSKPSPEGVALFRQAWEKMHRATGRLRELNKQIEAAKEEAVSLQLQYEDSKKELFTLMQGMDVQSNGNFGYESRFAWFMVELMSQIKGESNGSSNNQCCG